MHQDFVLIPDDQPGVLSRVGRALGDAGINIEGVSAFTGQGKGVVHLLVSEPERAQEALSDAGFEVRAARDVLVLDIADQPGSLGEICGRLSDAGVNIEQSYLATQSRLVLAVDDIEAARALLG